MTTKQQPYFQKSNSDFENGSHIARKKKAVANQFSKKNLREVVDLLNEENEEDAKYYAQYVK